MDLKNNAIRESISNRCRHRDGSHDGHWALPPNTGSSAFIDSAGIMKDCEQRNDTHVRSSCFCQFQPIFEDSRPVRDPMITVNWQGVIFQNFMDDQFQIHDCDFAGLVCQYAHRMNTPCSGSLSKCTTGGAVRTS